MPKHCALRKRVTINPQGCPIPQGIRCALVAIPKRMNANTVEIKSSHVPYISRPNDVFHLIDKAARAVR